MTQRFAASIAAVVMMATGAATPALAQGKPEKQTVHIGVGGKAALYYLPLSITERLGYFKDEGLDVEVSLPLV